jgi:diguanylate cyclase (GGDEF)-like protein
MLSAPTLLLFVAGMQPTRWSQRVRAIAWGAWAMATAGVLTGAFARGVMELGTPTAWDAPLGYGALLAIDVAYLSALTYLVFAYRAQRDPFERNRLKFVGVAASLVAFGGHTNLIPALQELPVDQGLNAFAAVVVAFSLVRYRLFNIDIVLRRSAIQVFLGLVVGGLYVGGLFAFDIASGGRAFTPVGFTFGLIVLGPPAGLLAHLVRLGTMRIVDRLFVGRAVDRRAAMSRLHARVLEVGTVDELVRDVADLAQGSLEASFVAVLLRGDDGVLHLSHVSGPYPRPQPEWTVRADNALLAQVAGSDSVVTPLRLAEITSRAGAGGAAEAELAPYNDCLLRPIVSRNAPVGLMAVGPKVYDGAFSLDELELLEVVAGQSALAIENARLFEQLQEHAQSDFLTGLPNHRRLQHLFRVTLEEAQLAAEPFAVAMVDIDNFKLLNDVHGHQAGDDALQRISALLRSQIREHDLVGRYGGDEFLFLLPGLTKEEGRELMTRVARAVRRTSLATAEGDLAAAEEIPARISWGVAAYPADGDTQRSLVSVADSDLLQRRFEMRRSGTVHTERPTAKQLLEHDPEKLRVARGLLDLIDAKDPYTSEHSQQVASFALLIADEAGLPDRERYALWLGGLLHDVGKVGTPADVLRKPGRLTIDEWDRMRRHPVLGEEVLRGLLGDMDDMDGVIDVVSCHHERFDGSGYPRGLAGDEIPRLARLISVADAFSAMVHDRPYRKGLSWADAVEELRGGAGTQFDPDAVELFARAIGHADDVERAA